MANIRPSADLRNNYNEISQFCKETGEPIFITKNGHGDLVVMSIDSYHRLAGREELSRLIDEGLAAAKRGEAQLLEDVSNGRIMHLEDAAADARMKAGDTKNGQ